MPFNLQASIGLDGSKFAAGLGQIEHQVDHLGKHLAGSFGALFGVAAIEQATHKTIEYGAHIYDLSRRLNVSAEDLQKWDYALTQNGSSLEAGAGFFEKLGIARKKALEGGEEQIGYFKELGITLEDLKSKNLQGIAVKIAEAIKEGDPQKLIAALRGVGGKAAGELVAAFKAGLPELFEEAEKLGLIIKDDVTVQLKEAEDEIKNMAKAMRADLAPAVGFVVKHISEMVDLLKIGAKSFGAYLGAKAGGASDADAKQAAYAAVDEVIDARIKREAAKKKKAEESGQGSEGGDDETTNKEKVTKEAAKQLRLKERLEEITRRNNLAELSAADRLNELEKERAAIVDRIGPPTAEEEIKAEEIRGEIINLKKGSKHQLSADADSLAKVGGFVGNAAAANPVLTVAQQSLEVQRTIARNTNPRNGAQF
jgi:hypothetical protein